MLRQFFDLLESERLEAFPEIRDYLSLELAAEREADRDIAPTGLRLSPKFRVSRRGSELRFPEA